MVTYTQSYLDLIAAATPAVAVSGAVGRNNPTFSDVAAQRATMWLLLRGLTGNTTADVSNTILAGEYAFTKQEAAGNFANGRGYSALQACGVDAFFLADFSLSFLRIMASSFAGTYTSRLNALKPGLTSAVTWLGQSTQQAELSRQDGNAPNRLLFDARAFILSGKVLDNNASLRTIGEAFITGALADQHADGYFIEHGGWDTSYQGVSILNIGILYEYCSTATQALLLPALSSAVEWLRPKIAGNGQISVTGNTRTGLGQEVGPSGQLKDVNYPEVALGLLYASDILADSTLRVKGEAIIAFLFGDTGAGPVTTIRLPFTIPSFPGFGTTGGTAAEGNDSRITGALQKAGGALTGAVTSSSTIQAAGLSTAGRLVKTGYVQGALTNGSTYQIPTGCCLIQITGGSTLATLTVKFPASPTNGEEVEIRTEPAITALTLQDSGASATNVKAAPTTLAAGARMVASFNSTTGFWYCAL